MKNYCLLLLLLTLTCRTIAQLPKPVFKNGDRVCFIGNSITYAGGFFHDIALFYATRYPGVNIEVINCGVPGNMAAQVLARMDSDILVHQPTVSVIKLGMNDVNKTLYTVEAGHTPGIEAKRQEALDTYRRDYEKIIRILLQHGSRIILQTPTIYDEGAALKDVRLPGRNAALKKCAGYVRDLAAKYRLPLVDYWTPLQDISLKLQAKDSTQTIIGPDRVHPGPTGHFIMGYTFLKTMHGAMPVATLSLDAAHPGKYAGVTGLSVKANRVSFTWKESALPFPMPKEATQALQLVPFMNDLNRETLRITQLPAGAYRLQIDGIGVGTYTRAQLNQGIDIAQNTATPQYQQAQKILGSFRELWKLEALYRYIKALQSGRAPLRDARNMADLEKYFDGLVKSVKDTTSTAYKDQINLRDTYLDAKRHEKENLQRMQQLHDQIYHENAPVPHLYQFIRQ